MVQTARPDWNALRVAYVHGTMTLHTLAAQHGLTPASVVKRCEREGWVGSRRQASESVLAAASVVISAERTDALISWNDNDLKVAKSLRAEVARSINAAKVSGDALTPVQLRALVGASEGVQRIGRLALGATTENQGISSPDGGAVATTIETPAEYEAAMRRIFGGI